MIHHTLQDVYKDHPARVSDTEPHMPLTWCHWVAAVNEPLIRKHKFPQFESGLVGSQVFVASWTQPDSKSVFLFYFEWMN